MISTTDSARVAGSIVSVPTVSVLPDAAISKIARCLSVADFKGALVVQKAWVPLISEEGGPETFLKNLASIKTLTSEQFFQYYVFFRNTMLKGKKPISLVSFFSHFKNLHSFSLDISKIQDEIERHNIDVFKDQDPSIDSFTKRCSFPKEISNFLTFLPPSLKNLHLKMVFMKDRMTIPSHLALRGLCLDVMAVNRIEILNPASIEKLQIRLDCCNPDGGGEFFSNNPDLLRTCTSLTHLDLSEYGLKWEKILELLSHCPNTLKHLSVALNRNFPHREVDLMPHIEMPSSLQLESLVLIPDDPDYLPTFDSGTLAHLKHLTIPRFYGKRKEGEVGFVLNFDVFLSSICHLVSLERLALNCALQEDDEKKLVRTKRNQLHLCDLSPKQKEHYNQFFTYPLKPLLHVKDPKRITRYDFLIFKATDPESPSPGVYPTEEKELIVEDEGFIERKALPIHSYYLFKNQHEVVDFSIYDSATELSDAYKNRICQALRIPAEERMDYDFRTIAMPVTQRILLFIPFILMAIAAIFSSYYSVRAQEIWEGRTIIVRKTSNNA